MDNISNSDYPVFWQLKRSWIPHQPHHQLLFSNELGCNNIEDKFNGCMPCITYSAVFHVYLRRSQILLIFNRLQVMHNVFSLVL